MIAHLHETWIGQVLINFRENKYLPVNGANVVETPAGDKTARRGIGTGHDPWWPQRYGMDFVRAVTVPHDQFAILGGWYQIPWTTISENKSIENPLHGLIILL